MSRFESELYDQNFEFIAGVDEAGRGPLAGPVVACACILKKDFLLKGLNDSKKINPLFRKELFLKLTSSSDVIYSIGIVDSKRIDEINILQATLEAMKIAILSLKQNPDIILIDGNQLPKVPFPMKGIIQGDTLSISIAAASIIAKETRDAIMAEYHLRWPEYDFIENKGYGTKKHLDSLKRYGFTDIHRLTFAPVKELLKKDV